MVYRIVTDDREYFEEHQSVPEAESNIPGQSRVTLDECFKLYTQEEKVRENMCAQNFFHIYNTYYIYCRVPIQ